MFKIIKLLRYNIYKKLLLLPPPPNKKSRPLICISVACTHGRLINAALPALQAHTWAAYMATGLYYIDITDWKVRQLFFSDIFYRQILHASFDIFLSWH